MNHADELNEVEEFYRDARVHVDGIRVCAEYTSCGNDDKACAGYARFSVSRTDDGDDSFEDGSDDDNRRELYESDDESAREYESVKASKKSVH